MKLEEITPFRNMIERYAWIALKKIKKPTIYSHEDLVSEATALLIEVKEKYYQPERNASLKTFFTLLLRNYFGEIILRSYSCHTSFPNEKWAWNYMERIRKKSTYLDPSEVTSARILVEEFSTEAYSISSVENSSTSILALVTSEGSR